MTFARWVFRIAGIYGLLTVAPMYFAEGAISRLTPPAVTHPEYFYGWISAALVFQVLFLLISADPQRYRPAMVVAVLEKVTWLAGLWPLAALGRVQGSPLVIGSVDALWAVLFALSWLRTAPGRQAGAGDEISVRR